MGFGLIAYAALEGLDGAQHVDHGAGQFGPHRAQVDGDQRQQVLGQPGLVGHEDVGGGGEGGEARLQFADFGLLGQEELLGEGMVVPGVISKMSWSDAAALSW